MHTSTTNWAEIDDLPPAKVAFHLRGEIPAHSLFILSRPPCLASMARFFRAADEPIPGCDRDRRWHCWSQRQQPFLPMTASRSRCWKRINNWVDVPEHSDVVHGCSMLGPPRWPGWNREAVMPDCLTTWTSTAQRQSNSTQVVWSTSTMAQHPSTSGMTRTPGPPSVRRQFPGSQRFWSLCHQLHPATGSSPLLTLSLTPRSLWDLSTRSRRCGPQRWHQDPSRSADHRRSVALCGCGDDQRLRRFLDLQLKLYSQQNLPIARRRSTAPRCCRWSKHPSGSGICRDRCRC